MIRRSSIQMAVLVTALSSVSTSCADALDALTSHARPVASVAGEQLGVSELATMMAESPLPDSALIGHWASEIGALWADYVALVRLYQSPDTTMSANYDALLEGARYYSAMAVQRYQDSVVLADVEPTDEEVRAYFDEEEPFTRLDVRRIRLGVPEDADEATRDSLLSAARRLRAQVAGGADFIEVARSASDEPVSARGQVLAYQGHAEFDPAADSVVFRLRPGEISPVIVTGPEMIFYRVERRRSPEFESVADMLRERLVERRKAGRVTATTDSLLVNSRRTVANGAEASSRLVATSADMAAGRLSGALRLVRYDGGELTVGELRQLFLARPDIRRLFAETDDEEEIGLYLYQLAGDEILVRAATDSGVEPTAEARSELREGIAGQLAAIARRLDISHALVTNPAFDVAAESRRFVRLVLERATPVPLATEFRPVLDQQFRSRVDERSAENAARAARTMRGLAPESESHEEGSHEEGPHAEPESHEPMSEEAQ